MTDSTSTYLTRKCRNVYAIYDLSVRGDSEHCRTRHLLRPLPSGNGVKCRLRPIPLTAKYASPPALQRTGAEATPLPRLWIGYCRDYQPAGDKQGCGQGHSHDLRTADRAQGQAYRRTRAQNDASCCSPRGSHGSGSAWAHRNRLRRSGVHGPPLPSVSRRLALAPALALDPPACPRPARWPASAYTCPSALTARAASPSMAASPD